MKNEMKLSMDAISENEALGRICIATFLTRLHPTLEELEDVKTAVSEAITNAIIHGVPADGKVYITCRCEKDIFHVEIEDHGVGIADIPKAMEPLYTTKPEQERSGMGFAFMEAFMDDVDVVSRRDIGTRITLKKFFSESDYSAVCKDIADSKSDLHDEKSENDSECISGRNTIEQTHGIIKAIRPNINVQNINARTSD